MNKKIIIFTLACVGASLHAMQQPEPGPSTAVVPHHDQCLSLFTIALRNVARYANTPDQQYVNAQTLQALPRELQDKVAIMRLPQSHIVEAIYQEFKTINPAAVYDEVNNPHLNPYSRCRNPYVYPNKLNNPFSYIDVNAFYFKMMHDATLDPTSKNILSCYAYNYGVDTDLVREVNTCLQERGGDLDISLAWKASTTVRKSAIADSQLARQLKVMELLIHLGADINARDSSDLGCTPLFTVFYPEVAQLLLKHGANPHVLSIRDGETPLFRLARHKWSKFRNVARLLIQHGAQVNIQNKTGDTPLHEAAKNGDIKFLQLLTEHGASKTTKNHKGNTPLHEAVDRSVNNTLRFLITSHGTLSTLNAQNNKGDTALHIAAQKGHKEQALTLINGLADYTIKNNDGKTPLDLALANSRTYDGPNHTCWDNDEAQIAKMLQRLQPSSCTIS